MKIITISAVIMLITIGVLIGTSTKKYGLAERGSLGIGEDGIAGTGIFPEIPLSVPSNEKQHSQKVLKLAEAAQHFNGKQLLGFISTYTENEEEMREVIEVIQEKFNEEQFKVVKHEVEKAEEEKTQEMSKQKLVGDYYFSTKNYKKAKNWYEKASKQDDTHSKYYLSVILMEGLGTPKDVKTALQLLFEAARRERQADKLLNALEKKEPGLNHKLLIEAAERGSHEAQNKLAYSYYHGTGDYKQDFYKAAYWFKKAALENKDALSAYRVAYIYSHEFPITKENLKDAIWWYKKAKELGEKAEDMDYFVSKCERQMRTL